MSIVPEKPPKVLYRRRMNKIYSVKRCSTINVVNALSAAGYLIPQALIFGRKRMNTELLVLSV